MHTHVGGTLHNPVTGDLDLDLLNSGPAVEHMCTKMVLRTRVVFLLEGGHFSAPD